MYSEENQRQKTDLMSNSVPMQSNISLKSINQIQSEACNKTTTKLPPLNKKQFQESSQTKQNFKDTYTALTLQKKTSEDQNIPSLKKLKPKKKEGDKKKNKIITPEVTQKFDQYKSFLTLFRLTNNLAITQDYVKNSYTLFVGKGNNSPLIKNIFRAYRPWWNIQQTNPDNPNINMYWYQLRQNNILQDFKEVKKTEADFQNCSIFVQEAEEYVSNNKIQKQQNKAKQSNQKRSSINIRSHSVTMKDRQFAKNMLVTTSKRSSSRAKIGNTSTQRTSPLKYSLKKQIKEQIENGQNKKKKALANPKMWPIYHNYRKIFSHSQLKQVKKLGVIKEDGKIYGKLSKNKIRNIQNRSNMLKSHNHLTNNWNLSNKKALFMNLKSYYQAKNENPFINIPMTFHVKQIGDSEYQCFQQQYKRRAEEIKQEQKTKKNNPNSQIKYTFKPKRRNAWLVKPGQNTNRGNGIEVVQTLEQINSILQKDTADKKGQPRTHIIQQYIIPFLYQKRKFDIRTYILITSMNGYQKGYWYQDGYIRTACKEFNMKNLANKYIHLTNDAVQKNHEDYGKYQPGNKLSYSDFQRYLDLNINANTQSAQKLKFWNQAYPQMKKLATDAIRSVYTKIDQNKKQFSFQIFGLDFLIDQNFKVWLIEANTNPCLELSCPLLGRVIPGMLENAFKLVVDTVFPPPQLEEISNISKKIILPDNPVQTNKFQLIFDEAEQGKAIKSVLVNAPQVKIYEIQEEEEEYDDIIEGGNC